MVLQLLLGGGGGGGAVCQKTFAREQSRQVLQRTEQILQSKDPTPAGSTGSFFLLVCFTRRASSRSMEPGWWRQSRCSRRHLLRSLRCGASLSLRLQAVEVFQEELEAANDARKVDRAKGKTLDEISAIVQTSQTLLGVMATRAS